MSKLIIERKDSRDRYSKPVDMFFLEDTRVNATGRLMGIYLQSLPATWEVSKEALGKVLGLGKEATDSAIKSLSKCGYLKIEKQQGNDGQFVWTWIIREEALPCMDEPYLENPVMDKKVKTKSSKANKTQSHNILNFPSPYPENPVMDKNPETQETHGLSGNKPSPGFPDLENPPIYKLRNTNEEINNLAPDKPAPGKKSSSKKSPTQSSGQDVPGEVYALMDYLKAAKKAQGVTDIAFDGRWRGVSKTAGKAMLESGLSVESVKDAIDWLLNSPFYGPGILSLYDVKQKLHVYQTQSKAVQSKPQMQATGTYGANDLDGDEIDRMLAEMRKHVEGAL